MDDKITYEDAKNTLEKLIATLNKDDLLDFSNHLVKKALHIRKTEGAELAEEDEDLTEHEKKSEKPATSIAERKKQRMLEKIRTLLRASLPPFALAPNEVNLMPSSLLVS